MNDGVVSKISGSSVVGGDDVDFKGIEAVDFDGGEVTLDIKSIKGL